MFKEYTCSLYPKQKTINRIIDILIGDWKTTGTLSSNFAILS